MNDYLQKMVEAFPEAAVLMDIEGRVVGINKVALGLLGYRSIDVVGKSLYDFAPAQETTTLRDLMDETRALGRIRNQRIRLYDVRGRLCILKASLSLYRDERSSITGLILVVEDVASISRLEKELFEVKDFSQAMLDEAGVGIAVTDLKGVVVFASRGVEEAFNWSSGSLVGRNIIRESGSQLALNERFERLIKTGQSFDFESAATVDGGKRFYSNIFTLRRDAEGRAKGAVVVCNEVTKILEMEGQLRDTNSILREQTVDLKRIVEITRRLGSFLEKNRIYEEMAEAARKTLDPAAICYFQRRAPSGKMEADWTVGFGKKPDLAGYLDGLKTPKIIPDITVVKALSNLGEIEGIKSAVFIPILRKKKVFAALALFLNQTGEIRRGEIEILQSIGNSAAVALENARLYSETKENAAQLEIKVRERTSELERSNKVKDLFIDIMRHDMLKPADIGRLSTELVLEMEEDEDKKDILEKILQSQERMIDLIENASILAKLESGEVFEISEEDLGAVLKSTVSELEDMAEAKNMDLKINAAGEYPALVNPLIYDVFSNLLGNAIKYGPENTVVSAKITGSGRDWRIEVSDSGGGIPDAYKEDVFYRFSRLEKGGVKGTGLGLAIVKRVVAAHKGRVWVEDNPGGGSTFVVKIPRL
ncbi:MAG: ATP-binding protein [Candidatus Hydrothermarchaeales archaeon]